MENHIDNSSNPGKLRQCIFEHKILDEKADLNKLCEQYQEFIEVISTGNSEIYKYHNMFVLKMFLENEDTREFK